LYPRVYLFQDALVADLEEHAFKRDRRFLVRLIALLAIGLVGGLWAVSHLTSRSFGTCAARLFDATTDEERGR
jgi:hypothetical protein